MKLKSRMTAWKAELREVVVVGLLRRMDQDVSTVAGVPCASESVRLAARSRLYSRYKGDENICP